MSGRAKRRAVLEASRRKTGAARKRAFLAGGVLVLVSAAIVAGISSINWPKNAPGQASIGPTRATNPNYPSLPELVAMSSEELAKVDIAVMNLRCAEGLPGAEIIDIAEQLKRIDGWAARIEYQTAAYAYKARDFERYGGVPGKYEIDMLTTVLQLEEGVRCDPEMIAIQFQDKIGAPEDTFYDDAGNVFVNGLTERQMGTCSSLPVLFIAIARRLGYPVHLVEAPGHLYLQWDDGRHKFNIEATSRGGLMSHPDNYYWHWPHPVSPKAAEAFYYFKPLSPRDELAQFLSMRATVLMVSGNMTGAVRCQMQAFDLTEHNKAGMRTVLNGLRSQMAMRQVEQVDALLDQRARGSARWPSPFTRPPSNP